MKATTAIALAWGIFAAVVAFFLTLGALVS